MAYKWSNDLQTGNLQIDAEHKELIKAINGLLEACSGGNGRGEVENTVKFLISYTRIHFKHEEELQKKYNYPGYINHKNLHSEFIKTVENIKMKLLDKGPSIALVGEVNSKLGDWLIHHIRKEDVKVAEHIRNCSK